MNNFYNKHEDIVSESLLGLSRISVDKGLEVLNALPQIKCILRADRDASKVAILSGGGAGHEPAHAGFIGQGMLTGAISGEVFASPSVDAVLAGIVHATGDAGCLLIVKNYTGDRLNFGLAAERAKNLGYDVEMVVVGDDISIKDSKQPRGIAGTLFVHKIAGYLSEKGASLSEIKARLDVLVQSIRSIGVAYSGCNLPGQARATELSSAELGLGIHGESGVEVFDPVSSQDTVQLMVDRLRETIGSSERVAVLINNLGSTSNIEMSIVLNDLLQSDIAENIELIFGPNAYMTAIDMHGFSLSMMTLDDDIKAALMAKTSARAWTSYALINEPSMIDLDVSLQEKLFEASSNPMVQALVEQVCGLLVESEAMLNELDAKVGDGDTGTTFANGARAVLGKLSADGLPMNELDKLFLTIGKQLSTAMGGSSGVLLSIFFTTAGNEFQVSGDIARAFKAGLETVSKYGGAKLGDRTMLDAAIPAIECLLVGGGIQKASKAANDGAEGTSKITNAKAGRSSYLRADSLKGINDPGAVAISMIFQKSSEVIQHGENE
ncbi:MAG: dihydroxyacetone kinase subunit DhaK [Arenicella sp.]